MLDFQCFKWLYGFTGLSLDKQKWECDKPKEDVWNIFCVEYFSWLCCLYPLNMPDSYSCTFVSMILSDLLIKSSFHPPVSLSNADNIPDIYCWFPCYGKEKKSCQNLQKAFPSSFIYLTWQNSLTAVTFLMRFNFANSFTSTPMLL